MTTDPIKLLVLTNEFPPRVWGGIGIAVYGLCLSLKYSGQAEIIVVTRERSASPDQALILKREPVDEISVLRVVAGNLSVDSLPRYIDPASFHIVHIHGVHFVSLAMALKERYGLPVIYSMHSNAKVETEFDSRLEAMDVPPEEAVVVAADAIVVQSESAAVDCLRFYPELAEKLVITPNGLNPYVEQAQPRTRDLTSTNRRICLYCGRFHPRKGMNVLIKAMPLVLEHIPQATFVFIGGHSSRFADKYRKILHGWSTTDQRVYQLDWQAPPVLVNWYKRVHAVVIPSLYEPFGNIAIEAMAMGTPVVASNVGGLRELVPDGVAGILVPPGEPEALAQGIIDLFSDQVRYRAFSRNAARITRHRYRWSRLVGQYLTLYLSTIAGRVSVLTRPCT
jgi:glycosyltransferase involved in cell wall biosynthesis